MFADGFFSFYPFSTLFYHLPSSYLFSSLPTKRPLKKEKKMKFLKGPTNNYDGTLIRKTSP